MGDAPYTGHRSRPAGPLTMECPVYGAFAIRRRDAVTPSARSIRECVDCRLPFYSGSAGNVVCPICKADSTANFEGEL